MSNQPTINMDGWIRKDGEWIHPGPLIGPVAETGQCTFAPAPESAETPTPRRYLVTGIGEQYDSVVCAEADLLETIMGLMFSPSSSAPDEEREYWREALADDNEWCHERSTFCKSVGEDEGISVYLIHEDIAILQRDAALARVRVLETALLLATGKAEL